MDSFVNKFLVDSEKKSFDKKHRATIRYNISRYDIAVSRGLQKVRDLQEARERAAFVKHKTLENLDSHLLNFEKNFTENGGKVIWATNSSDALNSIYNILETHHVRQVVKSKSMTTEEIELVPFLEANGIEATETDLGEYIVQISGDKPYHIVTPVMHKSAKDIAEIYNKKFQLSLDSKPEDITAFTREKIRDKFINSGAGITGANFIVSETGSIVLTENEGNGVMSMSWPPIHIVIAGIEKIIPSLEDLNLFLPLLSTHGTGQSLTAYNSIVSGSGLSKGKKGYNNMFVILLDNGRTNLLRTLPQRKALSCIRCGACLNSCPVYRNIGGHTYGTIYPGPIGAVITPYLKGFDDYKHLSYASSLCGKCTEVCPVKIDLHRLLLYNRNYAVKNRYYSKSEGFIIKLWKKAMTNRFIIDIPPLYLKNFFFKKIVAKIWGKRRSVPQMKSESFASLWKKKRS